MQKKRPVIQLGSKLNPRTVQRYTRGVFNAGGSGTSTPLMFQNTIYATGNTPPPPPPAAAEIYLLITELQDFLMTEAGENLTTE